MPQQPKVTIVIPFYNCPYVDQAIESALNQSYPNVEVIVVNDGSTQYVEKILPYLERIRYLEKPNGGTASALNMGIRNASGDYFSWLSSDDLYHREKTAKQLAFMQENDAYASFGGYVVIDADGKEIHLQKEPGIPRRVDIYSNMRNGCIINGCTVMLHMQVIRDVGLFDESLSYANDYDMWMRILPKYDFHYWREAYVFYRTHEKMGSIRFEKEIQKEALLVSGRHREAIEKLIEKELQ